MPKDSLRIFEYFGHFEAISVGIPAKNLKESLKLWMIRYKFLVNSNYLERIPWRGRRKREEKGGRGEGEGEGEGEGT